MTIRTARFDDLPAIAEVATLTWQSAYADILPAGYLASLTVSARLDRLQEKWGEQASESAAIGEATARTCPRPETAAPYWVAEEDGRIHAYCSAGPTRDPDLPFDAELYTLYVLESAQGRGVGKALLRTAATHLRERGFSGLLVCAFRDNLAAGAFYQALGARLCLETTISVGGVDYPDVAYGWNSIDALLARLAP